MRMSARRLLIALSLLAGLAAPARAQITPTSVPLHWTAPGDDSLSGTATQYDLRLSTSPITPANFAAATRVSGVPAPHTAGTAESFTVGGLTPSTTYWFALKTADDVGNWSGMSNVASTATAASSDSIRPAPLALSNSASTDNSVTLAWTAVGDDSLTGTANRYDFRWSTSPITDANFASATPATGAPAPAAAGTPQSFTITGLNRTLDLWFAAKVADAVNHWSALSNVVAVGHLLDTSPPAAPTGVAAAYGAGSGVRAHWNPNTEPDLAGYNVYRAPTASGPFAKLNGSLVASAAYTDPTPPDSASLWYQVTAVDQTGNESARSAAIRVWLAGAAVSAWTPQAAYPNPSRVGGPVTIPVEVPGAGPYDATLEILDSAGERVREIALTGITPGLQLVLWDGRNDAGRATAPGVYRAWFHAGGTHVVVKLARIP